MPEVTVLTAVRDGAKHLSATIESITNQTFSNWEYLLVDDASQDDTPRLVEHHALKDSRIRLIRRPISEGPYVAANTGLAEAEGKYIARIDADDVAPDNRLDVQVRFLREHTAYRACTGSWRVLNDDSGLENNRRSAPGTTASVIKWSLCVVGGIAHSTLCIERSLLVDRGGYRPWPVTADFDLWCDLTRRDALGVIPDVVALWRAHPDQISATRGGLQKETSLRVLHDHLREIGGGDWTVAEVGALWSIGHWQRVRAEEGLVALDRWEKAWRQDSSLSAAERRELKVLSARVRARHLRRCVDRSFPQVMRSIWALARSGALR